MARFIKSVSKTVGLRPGTLVHIGERKVVQARITLMEYDEQSLEEKEVDTAEACRAYIASPTVTWINVNGIHQMDMLEQLGCGFDLHPLVLEDIVNTDQRPKLEDYGAYLFVVVKCFKLVHDSDHLDVEQISFVIGPNYVISFEEGRDAVLDPVRQRIRESRGRVRRLGADYLAYALLDAVVDSYFTALEGVGDRVEAIEEELVEYPTLDTLQAIYGLKRTLIVLRKPVWPVREVIGALDKGEQALISEFDWRLSAGPLRPHHPGHRHG